eukprot:14651778-Ditylum_brightwellii.AAC.1
MGKSDRVTSKVVALKAEVRALTTEVKTSKATASSAMTKVDKIGKMGQKEEARARDGRPVLMVQGSKAT